MTAAAPAGASRLAQAIADLMRQSRATGDPKNATLHNGLHVRVETTDEDLILLWRKVGHPSPEEAATIAREAGWIAFDTAWDNRSGVRYLILRPSFPDDEEDPPPTEPLPAPEPEAPVERPYPEVAQRLQQNNPRPLGRFMCVRDELSQAEQEAFATCLRIRLPEPFHRESLTRYAAQVLGQPRLLHWRGLTRDQAQQVREQCEAEHPIRRTPETKIKV